MSEIEFKHAGAVHAEPAVALCRNKAEEVLGRMPEHIHEALHASGVNIAKAGEIFDSAVRTYMKGTSVGKPYEAGQKAEKLRQGLMEEYKRYLQSKEDEK